MVTTRVATAPMEAAEQALRRSGERCAVDTAAVAAAFGQLAAAAAHPDVREAADAAGRRWVPAVGVCGGALGTLSLGLRLAGDGYGRTEADAAAGFAGRA